MANTVDKIVIASGNAGKLREIETLLGDLGVSVLAQSALGVQPAEETGLSFVDNALQKARHAATLTGLPAIADDSGLVVAALGGRPGIYSARYAGPAASDEDNVDKLLRELEALAGSDGDGHNDTEGSRDAYFHCAAVFVRDADDPAPIVVEASWHGSISRRRSGTGGFGYDPVFFDPDAGCNSAEMSDDEKNRRSHRGQAMRQLAARLAVGLATDAGR